MRAAILLASLLLLPGLAHADWKSDLKSAAKQQANSKVEQTLGLPISAPAGTAVYFINLKNGDTVSNPMLIQFGLKAAGVAPAALQSEGTGHHVLLIDEPQLDYTLALPVKDGIRSFDKGQTEATLTLTPGKHTLQLLFADWKQLSFNPAVQSEKISITVAGAAAAPAKK